MPKVSIILPTYNRSWIIARAVKSVLDQTFEDFELVIIDDGSTDDTDEVLKKFSDSRIKLIKTEVNGGVCRARNLGLKNAKGELVAYLDSDNLWYKNYLEVMVDAFKKNIVLVYSGQNLILIGGAKDSPKVLGRKTRNEKYNLTKLTYGNYIDISCVLHKKAVLAEVGYFDENLKVLEDWDLFARIAIKYPFGVVHMDQVLGEYYYYLPVTGATQTNKNWQKWVERHFGIDKKQGDELKVVNKISKLIDER